MPAKKLRTCLYAALLACVAAANASQVVVGTATPGGILDWQAKSFVGTTRYSAVQRDARRAVRAESRASASALIREIDIDLTRTPVLHWSWQVGNLLDAVDETRKPGDDYAARVYVLFRDGILDPRPLGFSYVWSSAQAKGVDWPNAFTDRVRMLAVRDTTDPLRTWQEEQRNVREDIRRYFGKEVNTIKAVAIMTDTDNSGQQAVAWYGDIWFAAE